MIGIMWIVMICGWRAALKTWTELIALAKDAKTIIALENVYEKSRVFCAVF